MVRRGRGCRRRDRFLRLRLVVLRFGVVKVHRCLCRGDKAPKAAALRFAARSRASARARRTAGGSGAANRLPLGKTARTQDVRMGP